MNSFIGNSLSLTASIHASMLYLLRAPIAVRTPTCGSEVITHRAGSSGPLQLGGGLQAAVLLPVVPAGGAQSALHVGWPPGVPLLGLGRCGEPEENSASEKLPVSTCGRQEAVPITLFIPTVFFFF